MMHAVAHMQEAAALAGLLTVCFTNNMSQRAEGKNISYLASPPASRRDDWFR